MISEKYRRLVLVYRVNVKSDAYTQPIQVRQARLCDQMEYVIVIISSTLFDHEKNDE